jgi:hypothetical protein
MCAPASAVRSLPISGTRFELEVEFAINYSFFLRWGLVRKDGRPFGVDRYSHTKELCGKMLPELPDETIVRGTGDSFLGAAP